MSSYSPGRGPRPADPDPRLRLAALSAVILGVALLAAAAFALSYAGIHQIALRAGVSPGLARLYPFIFDATLVIAAAAALSLRGAGLWPQGYAWFSLLLMLAAVATGDALHATNATLPPQPTRALVAVSPWVLLLLAFGLLLEMLRHFRRVRMASAAQVPAQARALGPAAAATSAAPITAGEGVTVLAPAARAAAPEKASQPARGGTEGAGAGNGDAGVVQRAAVTWANAPGAGEGRPLPQPRSGLDALFGPREGQPPGITAAAPAGFVTTKPEEYPDHPPEGAQPPAEQPAEGAAEPGEAPDQDTAGPDAEAAAPQAPEPGATPTLDRLRSSPARPDE